jgi:hypothetical protein
MAAKGGGSITSREGPGPGEYQAKEIFSKLVGPATFGKNQRLTLDKNGNLMSKYIKDLPGPGTYEDKF